MSLLKQAGGVLVGKCNMDEFAMGSNNEHSYFGPVQNPLFDDKSVSPGGSSGGSAAAVAADMCDIALGSDTGGSVRLPAAYCGVIGFKPSYGLISRNGVVAYAQSLDTVGICGKDLDLVAETFDVLNQYDPKDPTSLLPEQRAAIESAKSRLPKERLNIGVVREAIVDLSPEVREAWLAALDLLRSQGHSTTEVSIPSLKSSLPTYFVVSPSEASSNLARYDGVRYGSRAEIDKDDIGTLYGPTRSAGFGAEVQRRILLGTYNLSSGAYKEHFMKAQQVRRKIQLEFNEVFAMPNVLDCGEVAGPGTIDVLVHPTARTPAPTHEEMLKASSIEHYINDVLTVPANLAGLPAISVPFGPPSVGMQVWGQYGDDELVLAVARELMAGR